MGSHRLLDFAIQAIFGQTPGSLTPASAILPPRPTPPEHLLASPAVRWAEIAQTAGTPST
jgi:hypothetical protein